MIVMKMKVHGSMTSVSLTCRDCGGRVVLESGLGWCWRHLFSPDQAVRIWRCLMGDAEEAVFKDVCGDSFTIVCSPDDIWTMRSQDGMDLCVLDADQAMALAWAIQNAAAHAMRTL